MATIHQVSTASIGAEFSMVGPVFVDRQGKPKEAKNGKKFSSVVLKNAGSELLLMLWGEAAMWKLPLAEVTLKGKFTKEEFKNNLRCEELIAPEGSVMFEESDVQGESSKPSIKHCIDAGLRAVDYVSKENYSFLSDVAFTFAANAALQGVRIE